MKRYHKLLAKSELHIGLVVLAVCLLIQLRSGLFFSSNNLVDIASVYLLEGGFTMAYVIDANACISCGACMADCPSSMPWASPARNPSP